MPNEFDEFPAVLSPPEHFEEFQRVGGGGAADLAAGQDYATAVAQPAPAPSADDVNYNNPGWQAQNLTGPLQPFAQQLRNEIDPAATVLNQARGEVQDRAANLMGPLDPVAEHARYMMDPSTTDYAGGYRRPRYSLPVDPAGAFTPEQRAQYDYLQTGQGQRPPAYGQPTPEPPPPPEQSVWQDLRNVPANVGASVARGAAGVGQMAGQAVQYPGRVVGQMGQMFPGNPGYGRAVDAINAPAAATGQFLDRQGNYLAAGAQQVEQDNPVRGEVGKLAVGMGTLGVDAAVGYLTGGAGFTASFAGRSAGTMYRQAIDQGDDPGTATEKALTAGFTAAVAPQLAHVLPPQAGEAIAAQVAKSYLGTGSMVAAQATADELTLKSGTGQRIDLSKVFPEAVTQGLIGVLMHGAGTVGGRGDKAAELPQAQRMPGKDYDGVSPLRDRSIRPGLVGQGEGAEAVDGFGGEKSVDPFPVQPRQVQQPEPAFSEHKPPSTTFLEEEQSPAQEPPRAPQPPVPPAEAPADVVPAAGARAAGGGGEAAGQAWDPADYYNPHGDGNGWKLHLTVPDGNRDAVESGLSRMGVPFKRGRNGGQEGKDFTVYVGAKDQAQAAADHINRTMGNLLAKPGADAVENDRSFGGNVLGRFDVQLIDSQFGYGREGVPHQLTDIQNRVFGGSQDQAEATRRADAILRNRYGEFYTGAAETPSASNADLTPPPAQENAAGRAMPVIEPSPTSANEPPRVEQPTEQPPVAVKRKPAGPPKPFSKRDLERRLLQHYDETEGASDFERQAQAEDATQYTGGGAEAFRAIPSDLREQFTPKEWQQVIRRKIVRVAKGGEHAGGEDAISESGMGFDRYVQMVKDRLRQTVKPAHDPNSKIAAAIDAGRNSPDPEMQLLAAIHDNMPTARNAKPTQVINPSEQPTGTRFTLHGSKFEIVEGEDGHRLLKDGDEYPVVPADYIDKMPADKGSVKGPEATAQAVPTEPTSLGGATAQGGELRQWEANRGRYARQVQDAILDPATHAAFAESIAKVKTHGGTDELPRAQQHLDRAKQITEQPGWEPTPHELRNIRLAEEAIAEAKKAAPQAEGLDALQGEQRENAIRALIPKTARTGTATTTAENGVHHVFADVPNPDGVGYKRQEIGKGWNAKDAVELKRRINYPQDFPASKPKFFDPAAEGIKSGAGVGIFGQTTFEPATGNKQGSMFHEPVEVRGGNAESAQDARIRGKFKEGEEETGKLLGYGKPVPAKKPRESTPRTPKAAKEEVAKGLLGKSAFINNDVIPTAQEGVKAVHEAAKQLQRAFAPQTGGEQAKMMQGIAREHGATLAQRGDRAVEAFKEARNFFEGRDAKDNYDFIAKVEEGGKHGNPVMDAAAKKMREVLDGRRREVQALGKGKLEHFIQDYFPHIWADPEAAGKAFASILGKRPLEGSKGFLKKRSIDTFSQGIELGLKPISDNPVDLVLLKVREMDRYILGQQMLQEMKAKDLAKFVRATDRAPEGFTKIDDKIATVYGPPTVAVTEHVDKVQHDALNQVLDNLGIKHERVANTGGRSLGYSVQGDSRIATEVGTDLSVLAHEIGHQIDQKYGLGGELYGILGPAHARGTVAPDQAGAGRFKVGPPEHEWKALTKLRFTNVENPSPRDVKYNSQRDEQLAMVVEAYVHAPERMKEAAPALYRNFDAFVGRHPELLPLRERPSLSLTPVEGEVPHGGLLKMGEYFAPDAAAHVVNNYLSPGLRDKSGLFRAYLGTANVMNQAQLGFSAFHVGFTSMDAMTSKLALAIEQAVARKPVEAFKALKETPLAAFTNILQGSKLLKEWVKPGSEGAEIRQLVDGLKAAGGRAKQDTFYRTDMARKMTDAFRQGNILGGLLRVPPGLADLVAKPVMEYIVPRQKLGIFADLARKELAKLGPDATRDEVRSTLGKAWDSVDNRMGQVVYDNLFWRKSIKDIGMASVRSLGWNLGTFRELGGGAFDFAKAGGKLARLQKPEFTHRMAYTLAMPALAGMIGGTLHYLMTGERPQELKDYFFPKTGDTDDNGHDVRLSLPSYIKDVYAYAHAPLATLGHKLHPAIAATIEMLENRDFYGTKIRNEDDPIVRQAKDVLEHAAKQFVPFGVQGYQKLNEEGAGLAKKALPFVGITQAPSSVSLSKAEQVAQELMSDRMPQGTRTKEEAARSQGKRDLVRTMKKTGDSGERQRLYGEAEKAGVVQKGTYPEIQKEASQPKLLTQVMHLDAPDAMKVWDAATPAERAKLKLPIQSKVRNSKTLGDDDKRRFNAALEKP